MTFFVKEPALARRTPTICAGGELDMFAAPALQSALTEAIDGGARRVLVDLTEASFVDSTTIGVLVAASRQLREAGGLLCLRCSNRNVLRTFEIVGLERQMPISRAPDPSERVVVVPARSTA